MMHVGLVSWEALLSKGIYIAKSQREIISGGIYIRIVQCNMYTLHWMSCSQKYGSYTPYQHGTKEWAASF